MHRAILLALLICTADAADGHARPPTHKTMSVPRAPARDGCLDNSRLLSHVAFTTASLPRTKSCSQLLSTDTLVAVRHWGRT